MPFNRVHGPWNIRLSLYVFLSFRVLALLQRSLQYLTSSHTAFHFLRHVYGLSQTMHIFVGKCCFFIRCSFSLGPQYLASSISLPISVAYTRLFGTVCLFIILRASRTTACVFRILCSISLARRAALSTSTRGSG